MHGVYVTRENASDIFRSRQLRLCTNLDAKGAGTEPGACAVDFPLARAHIRQAKFMPGLQGSC